MNTHGGNQIIAIEASERGMNGGSANETSRSHIIVLCKYKPKRVGGPTVKCNEKSVHN